MKKKTKKLMKSYYVTLFLGVTLSFFIWLSWNKLTDYLGNSDLVWMITGGVVVLAIIIGHFSFKSVAEKLT